MLKKNKICLLYIIIIAGLLWGGFWGKRAYICYSNVGIKESYPFGGIDKNNCLVQELKMDQDVHIESIRVLLATYGRTNTAETEISLYKNHEIVSKKILKDNTIKDNKLVRVQMNTKFEKGDILQIVIKSDNATEENMITVWVKKTDVNHALYKFNPVSSKYELQEGELAMEILERGLPNHRGGEISEIIAAVLWFLILCCVIGIYWTIFRKVSSDSAF